MRRDPGERRTIIALAASRSMVPEASPSSVSTTSPWRFSVIALPMKESFASLPLPLR